MDYSKDSIIELIKKENDEELLDLIKKLLLHDSGN